MLTNIQEEVITHFEENRFSITMHSRQTGTWFAAATYAVKYALENAGKTIMIATPRFDTTSEAFNSVTRLSKENHAISITKLSEKLIEFDNKSKIVKTVLHKHTTYNQTVDVLILLDFACGAANVVEKFYSNMLPSVLQKQDSRVIICSNPNGYNLFYKIFQEAEHGKNMFKSLRLYYWMNKDMQITNDWIADKIRDYGEDGFNEQYNLCYRAK